jgi:hypothetical protein
MYRLSRSGRFHRSGPRTKSGLLLAGSIALSSACSSEKEPNAGGLGGAGGSSSQFDASVPNFPGDGLEATPEDDISDREVPQLPSDEFMDSVIDVKEGVTGGGNNRDASAPDAAVPDAGPDGST